MNRVIDGYCRLLTMLMVLMLALMVVLVFGNVVLRYGFNSGITVSEEVSRWLFLWMTFLGAIVALREHGHLGTDVLVARLPKAGKKACLLIGQVLMLYVTWLVFRGSWTQTVINLDTQAPVTGAPIAVVYGTGVVFAVSAGVLLARELWRTVRGEVGDADLVMVQESEDLAQVRDLHIGESGPADPRR
ncbi:MAG TPA: TRAP transporter small permease [Burkholderiales bacterium]|nr:TRAP transporter small permease [Burkholderiales bacterium]